MLLFMLLLQLLALLVFIGLFGFSCKVLRRWPVLEANWAKDQCVLPSVEFRAGEVSVRNIRNIEYRTVRDYTLRYYDRSFKLDELMRVWLTLDHFEKKWKGPAHTMLSFEFEGAVFLALSVEIRRIRGQRYSPFWGLFRRYHLMYVLADERDIVALRSHHRRHEMYLYPVATTEEGRRLLLRDVLERTERLRHEPEFYHTLWNSCTTNIVRHVRHVAPGRIPPSPSVLIPGYCDKRAFQLGLIDSELDYEATRKRWRISDHVEKVQVDEEYSTKIREAGRLTLN